MTSPAPPLESASGILAAAQAMALPPGTRLSEYEVRSVLGCGGFGIVYLAWDHGLQREVAIKEYMPAMLAGRGPEQQVSVRSQATASTFALGLRSFVNEARLLAQFNHPSLVKVHRFWEANDTAYMVMPRYRGRTLRQVRAGMSEPPGDVACRHVLKALMSALDVLHRDDVFHRDIAPDNILLCDDGTPVLLDFGAARRVIGQGQQALTSILKPHYAPLEQYADQRSLRQGPWTDLYALGATLYYFVTCEEPIAAASRALHDDQVRLSDLDLPDLSAQTASLVDWMLELKPQHRPQAVQALRDVLDGHADAPLPPEGIRAPHPQSTRPGVASLAQRTDLDPTEQAPAPADASSQTVMVTGNPATAPGQRASAVGPATANSPDSILEPTMVNTATAAAPAELPAPPLRNGLILLGLLAINVLAWWWFTRASVSTDPTAGADGASAGASAVAQARSPSGSAAAATARDAVGPDRPAQPVETIVSVLPGRVLAPAASQAASPARPVKAEAPAAPVMAEGAAPDLAPPPAPAPRGRSGATERPSAPTSDAPVASASPTATRSQNPRERCGDRMFIAMSICIKRECNADSAIRNHPECVRMREIEEAQRNPGN
jgi:serine/threonine protein kinase